MLESCIDLSNVIAQATLDGPQALRHAAHLLQFAPFIPTEMLEPINNLPVNVSFNSSNGSLVLTAKNAGNRQSPKETLAATASFLSHLAKTQQEQKTTDPTEPHQLAPKKSPTKARRRSLPPTSSEQFDETCDMQEMTRK